MGRQKGKQRTKGNVLPSSSARTAELLSKEGDFQSGGLSNIPELDPLYSQIDSEFQIVIKKLYKRDSITKLKSLKEFSELCNSKTSEDAMAILPFWPRIYRRLFEDSDRRIREHGQYAMASLVAAVGKNLAPYLKKIMGYWFLSQCDPYSPCASVAENSLATAFHGPKLISAYVHCREEILKLVYLYLFGAVPPANVSEETENNSYRIVATSLEGLALYIKTVCKEKQLVDEIEGVLREAKFWKFSKHKYAPIRGAFNSVVESICMTFPDILQTHLGPICRAVLYRLDDSSIAVCRPAYNAAVAIVSTNDSWAEHIDLNKGVIPALCNTLKAGCHGMSHIVLPCLLPLCSRFPKNLDIPLPCYYKIFSALLECMKHDQIRYSKPSLNRTFTAFVELLRFAVQQIACDDITSSFQDDFITFLVEENIMPVLILSFKQNEKRSSYSLLYKLLASAVQSWSLQANFPTQSLYKNLYDSLLSKIESCVLNYMTLYNDDPNDFNSSLIMKTMSFLQELLQLQNLSAIPSQQAQPQSRVTFQSDHNNPSEANHANGIDYPNDNVEQNEMLKHVQTSVNLILVKSFGVNPPLDSKYLLVTYSKVLKQFGTKYFYEMLLGERDTGSADLTSYYNNILIPDILRYLDNKQFDVDTDIIQAVADVILQCLVHCESEEAMNVTLATFCQSDVKDVKFLVSSTLFSKLVKDEYSHEWRRWVDVVVEDPNSHFWTFVWNIISGITSANCQDAESNHSLEEEKVWLLLKNILTFSYSMEEPVGHLFSQAAFEKIMKKLSNELDQLQSECKCLDCYNRCLTKVSSIALECRKSKFDFSFETAKGSTIWLTMMESLLQSYCMLKQESSNTVLLYSSFLNSQLLYNEGDRNLSDLTISLQKQMQWLKAKVLLHFDSELENKLERLKKVIEVILTSITSQEEALLPVKLVTEHFFLDSREWEELRSFALEDWYDDHGIVTGEQIPSFSKELKWVKMKSPTPRYRQYLETTQHLYKILTDVLHEVSNGEGFCYDRVSLVAKEHLAALVLVADEYEAPLFEKLGEEFRNQFIETILRNSYSVGGIWPHCIKKLKDQLFPEDYIDFLTGFLKDLSNNSEVISLPRIQTVSSLMNLLAAEELENVLIKIVDWLKQASDITETAMGLFSLATDVMSKYDLTAGDSRGLIVQKYLELVLQWRETDQSLFLFENDGSSQHLISFNSDIARLFSVSVKENGAILNEGLWDFICCSIVAWFETISHTFDKNDTEPNTFVIRLLNASLLLLTEINTFVSSPGCINDPLVPANLVPEWKEFFCESVHLLLLPIFITLSSLKPAVPCVVLENLHVSLSNVTTEHLMSSVTHLKTRLLASSRLPDGLQTLLNHLCPLLYPKTENVSRILQITAFKMLERLLPKVPMEEENVCVPLAICNVIKESLVKVQEFFVASSAAQTRASKTAISDSENDEDLNNEIEENANLTRFALGNNYSVPLMAYFLSWKLLLRLTTHFSDRQKSFYVNTLMSDSFPTLTEDLLPKLFKYMPDKSSYFNTEPFAVLSSYGDDHDFQLFKHVACSLYKDFLLQMPAASRTWFNDLSKVVRSRVDKFTATHVSPVLIQQELKEISLADHQQTTAGMQVLARPSAREVLAIYKLNDVDMQITVCLPPNHPLGPITVNTEKRWVLQITAFLLYQNGSIVKGLLLWKEKVDKRFEGVEECMICFSLAHGSNQTLPKLKCKTCKKRYHAECLYKWFDTSNNSTCPLCRTPMIFR